MNEKVGSQGVDEMSNSILDIVQRNGIDVFSSSIEDINFKNVTQSYLKKRYSKVELEQIISELKIHVLRSRLNQVENVNLVNQSIDERQKVLVSAIMDLVFEYDIYEFSSIKHLNFDEISQNSLEKSFSIEELQTILNDMKSYYSKESYSDDSEIKNVKEELIEEIDKLVYENEIQIVDSIEQLNFDKLTKNNLAEKYSIEQLKVILRDVQYEVDEINEYVVKPKKKEIINLIEELIYEHNISEIESFEYIDFNQLKNSQLEYRFTLDELKILLKDVQDKINNIAIDQMELLLQYSDGLMHDDLTPESDETVLENWRNYIPSIIVRHIGFEKKYTIALEEIYEITRKLINDGNRTGELFDFLNDLVEAMESNEASSVNEGIEEEDTIISDEISEIILKTLEMIMLPHLEVLDKLRENPNLKFANIWTQPFNEDLKKAVKERDEWKCVVCESETDLHVHHKIPRKLGGINHMFNLVTVCSSCHPSIETADIKKAHKKCLANYKKQKLKPLLNKPITKNKSIVKEEILDSLESLLIKFSNKGDDVVSYELAEIIKKAEYVFYN